METSYQQPIAPHPTNQRPTTGTWGWVALAFGTVVISVPADLFILLVFAETCGQPAEPAYVLQGQIAMLVVLLVAALPWTIAVLRSRNGGRGVVIGLVALLPALGFLVHGLTAGAWSTSLCLGG